MKLSVKDWTMCLVVTGVVCGGMTTADAQVVPGTGKKLDEVGDTFEDEKWEYVFNLPKASRNLDKQNRFPIGTSRNGRLYESTYRGQPDIIKRVPTPEGGIPGSKGSLMLRSLNTGAPGVRTRKSQQDDLLFDVARRLGGFLPVSWTPSVVVRVYLPPWEEWDDVTDSSFGFRADLQGMMPEEKRGFFFVKREVRKMKAYWPGFFIQYNSKRDSGHHSPYAAIIVRGDDLGNDFVGKVITKPGWWTLGMSFTPDGKVHYYASEGADDLTRKDYISSSTPYRTKAERFSTMFFNVVSRNDGKHWSTPWVVDDPSVFVATKR